MLSMNRKNSQPLRKSVGWSSDLIVRPDTPLTNAQRKEFARTVKRAKRDGKIAATAQQTIPYVEMYRNGMCDLGGGLYSKSVQFEDRAYTEVSDDEQVVIFDLYCDLLNYFGPSVGLELSVICYYPDLKSYEHDLSIPPSGDALDPVRQELSDFLLHQAAKCKVERRMCLTYTVQAEGLVRALSRLDQIESDVIAAFRSLGSTARPMDGYERLAALHQCLHLDTPQQFKFNWNALIQTGLSSKDFIAPSSFQFKDGRYFRVGASYGAASFLQIDASRLSHTLLNSLLDCDACQIFTIHAKALEHGAALKAVKRKLSDLDKTKIDEQKRATRTGYDYDILPPDLKTYAKEAENLLEALQSHDEKLFMVSILMVHIAPSRQKLENILTSVGGIASAANCELIRLDYQQEQGYMSALPLGVNLVEIQRGMTTSGTAIFLPFRTCEVYQPGGLYYGVNALTNQIIIADRKTLKCPNGIVLGTPGSGKSFFAKREIVHTFFTTDDDQLMLDSENEYTALTEALGGQVIYLAPDSKYYLNPMDLDLSTDVGESPMLMQADFIMSQCELMMANQGNTLMPIERSLLDRCIGLVYREYLKEPKPEKMPVLGDLYRALKEQHDPRADDLATAMEIYVTGSLSYLNHRTNIDLHNRLVCYNTSRLGQGLKKLVMSNVQKHIWQRTTANRYAGKTTRIILDEFHLLLKEPQTAAYTAEIYKRFRKWNGIPTALTQNVKDLLASPEIENILENSDFVLMLNQGASDRAILAQRLSIAPDELAHVTNSGEGQGLLFFGDKVIPFEDRFPKNTRLYQLMTTKPNEKFL